MLKNIVIASAITVATPLAMGHSKSPIVVNNQKNSSIITTEGAESTFEFQNPFSLRSIQTAIASGIVFTSTLLNPFAVFAETPGMTVEDLGFKEGETLTVDKDGPHFETFSKIRWGKNTASFFGNIGGGDIGTNNGEFVAHRLKVRFSLLSDDARGAILDAIKSDNAELKVVTRFRTDISAGAFISAAIARDDVRDAGDASFDGLYAAAEANARENIRQQLLEKSNISEETYQSNASVKVVIDENTETLLQETKPAIEMAVEGQIDEATDFVIDKIDELESATIVEELYAEIGLARGTVGVIFGVGKGTFAPQSVDGDGLTDLLRATGGVTDNLEQMTQVFLAKGLQVNFLKYLADADATIELKAAVLHAEGRVPFNNAAQWARQSVALDQETYDAAYDTFLQLDSAMLTALFQKGSVEAFISALVGEEQQYSLGAQYQVNDRNVLHLLLAYQPENERRIEEGFYARILAEHIINDHISLFAGAGWIPVYDTDASELDKRFAGLLTVRANLRKSLGLWGRLTVTEEDTMGQGGITFGF